MFLNLFDFYNHIIFEKKHIDDSICLNKAIYGIDGIVLVEVPNMYDMCISIKDLFNHQKLYDNIVCDGQVVFTNLNSVKKINIIGFSEYGTVHDELIIVTDENKHFSFEFALKTFHTNYNHSIENVINKKCTRFCSALGSDGQIHNFFSYEINLKKSTNIKEIKLPINLSIHIVGIYCY